VQRGQVQVIRRPTVSANESDTRISAWWTPARPPAPDKGPDGGLTHCKPTERASPPCGLRGLASSLETRWLPAHLIQRPFRRPTARRASAALNCLYLYTTSVVGARERSADTERGGREGVNSVTRARRIDLFRRRQQYCDCLSDINSRLD